RDAKSKLQEIVQARFKSVPIYRIMRSQGAAHEQVFEVECAVPQLKRTALGSGLSRQRAEQDAARAMLQQIDQA
ncbi:MAG: putative dsRNA-binding protein, partial [Pseudomonadota bacterium]|nr:putative dsRNA-binding protein [Pseudomonadota bacterium]